MKNFIILFFLLAFLSGCTKQSGPCCEPPLMKTIHFVVENEGGVDLLNPENEGRMPHSNIKHYQLKDGEKVLLRNPNLLFFSQYHDGRYVMGVSLSSHIEKEGNKLFTVDIIEYDRFPADTIRSKVVHEHGSMRRIPKFWLNGEERDDHLTGVVVLVK